MDEFETSAVAKVISMAHLSFYLAAALTVTVPWVAIGLWVLAALAFLTLILMVVASA